tara:strand:- start:437 stop:964 length:528 start_codon:yes stop_codon:yes gene_type:complete
VLANGRVLEDRVERVLGSKEVLLGDWPSQVLHHAHLKAAHKERHPTRLLGAVGRHDKVATLRAVVGTNVLLPGHDVGNRNDETAKVLDELEVRLFPLANLPVHLRFCRFVSKVRNVAVTAALLGGGRLEVDDRLRRLVAGVEQHARARHVHDQVGVHETHERDVVVCHLLVDHLG